MNPHQFIQTELSHTGIYTITLNRPDKLNALNQELMAELQSAIELSKTDPQIKAILLTGAGKAFCAGADINQFIDLNAWTGTKFAKQGQAIFRGLEELGKPSLAAINGYAFGGGCELCLSTSIRIASANAIFCQPEVKLGLIPGFGGTQRLARLVGKGRALDLCLTARQLKAEDALNWGLVTEITTADNLLPRAYELLNTILQMGPLAITSVLRVIDAGYDLPLADALQIEALYFGVMCSTEDKLEGAQAFLTKRAAQFRGK